jgi:predicted dehydrogenase
MAEVLRVGILGAGFAAESHAAAYNRLSNVEVTAVWNRNRTRAEALAAKLGHPTLRVYDDGPPAPTDVDRCLRTEEVIAAARQSS